MSAGPVFNEDSLRACGNTLLFLFFDQFVRNRFGNDFHVAGFVGASLCVCCDHLFACSFTMCVFMRFLRIKNLERFGAEGFGALPFVGQFAGAAWDDVRPNDFHQDFEAGVVMEVAYMWV